ncbi:helix-turn-helix domain-containing protein [Chryseobacterium sp. NRRL B-14859]|uniref:helix-turn-helix domain-containing protein n=1 Tax=unclassified Chryseobacterium TaxID=2593645 RepID=UPI000F44F9FA|nr:helix-turn-helix domain-containing protein [Chryseobacterium sp. G0240]ROI05119.1 helix-turn-helix domain-containing protein [Chryseobacterium sp. G0240]
MKNIKGPDYKRIYSDMIRKKLPQKEGVCRKILTKERLDILDVINLNKILFGHHSCNQKYKAYNEKAIKKILTYQRKHNLNNIQLARKFSLSRNTITKWKKTIEV